MALPSCHTVTVTGTWTLDTPNLRGSGSELKTYLVILTSEIHLVNSSSCDM
jgi:hypothetical protein